MTFSQTRRQGDVLPTHTRSQLHGLIQAAAWPCRPTAPSERSFLRRALRMLDVNVPIQKSVKRRQVPHCSWLWNSMALWLDDLFSCPLPKKKKYGTVEGRGNGEWKGEQKEPRKRGKG